MFVCRVVLISSYHCLRKRGLRGRVRQNEKLMISISKIKAHNFKRFKLLELGLNKNHNVFIGDNESGKSSILSAIDLVLSGSRHRIDSIGLKNIFNVDAVNRYMTSQKKIEDLPILFVELFLDGVSNPKFYGRTNSFKKDHYGIRLLAEPDSAYHNEIKILLNQTTDNFPFEYYSVNFKYFSDESYIAYTKPFKHLLIDSTQINNKTATNRYVHDLYESQVAKNDQIKLKNKYREQKINFKKDNLNSLSPSNNTYNFAIKSNSESNLLTDLTIEEDGVAIENRGKGRQCIIKTEFALAQSSSGLSFALLEEPENHLSHLSMRKLVQTVKNMSNCQLFIATHNNLICNRLDLRNAILLNAQSSNCVSLNNLSESTAGFFIKAPDNNILEYVMSGKVILVEGDAEFMLIKELFLKVSGKSIEESEVHIISVGGTSFKRYIEIGTKLKLKTAIITDNDTDYDKNVMKKYDGILNKSISVFAEKNNSISTFEIAIYDVNKQICDDLFSAGRKKLTVLEYMLQNKADVAYHILDKKSDKLVCPNYIKSAIEWIIS